MDTTITFGTFNVGKGWGDHWFMLQANAEQMQKMNKKIQEANSSNQELLNQYEAEYKSNPSDELFQKMKSVQKNIMDTQFKLCDDLQEKVEKSVANKLADNLNVIALQELANLERPFAQTLNERGFEIYRLENSSMREIDTAIAVNPNLFAESSIKNVSFKSHSGGENCYGQDVAAVEAELKDSGTKVRFSSLHSWGFMLYHPDQKENRVYSDEDTISKQCAVVYTKEALKADDKSKASFCFIGGDMNNNPDNFKEPFDDIENNGYAILEPNSDTGVNKGGESQSPSYKDRKIDFLFAKGRTKIQSIWNKISSLFVPTTQMKTTQAEVLEDFDFKLGKNCSDHKPVATEITFTAHGSTAAKIWNSIKRFFVR